MRSIFPFLRTARRAPALLLAAVLAGGGGYAYETLIARPQMAYLGLPAAVDYAPRHWHHVLRNRAYLVGYSELRGTPLWVEYRIEPIAPDAPLSPRPERFERDWRGLTRIEHRDYTGSGFDRGHMAPNYAIARIYGREAQRETFLMTNVVPQRPQLNQRLWERLEEIEAGRFGGQFETLWVITGPVFADRTESLKSSRWVDVPSAFFKIYAAPGPEPRLLAFVVPQEVKGNERLVDFVTSVERVQQLTGLDFFPELPAGRAQMLETAVDAEAWGIARLDHRPPRH